ncbi:MAG: hypothetical protein G01um10147_501 [Microgenomates group bacterium Gr01-1014_7]|nr:MAG: hypothetical protein G01um10147_501 [Microgenomates group bacterium Gr01-1014_7]
MEDHDRDIELSNQAAQRASGRIPEGEFENMNINSYIASLTDIANAPRTVQAFPENKKSLDRAAGMYAYLRDKHHAQTVGDAFQSLA